MEFYRNLLGNLREWRKSPYRKPLVIRGARQTGKTTVVKEFGAEFDTFIYLNMDIESDLSLFRSSLSVKEWLCFPSVLQG
ncbi:MAG: AAA family ATPase [Spirochaetia bacterium]|jgi:predicted AAA+ superfamily ATPase|nr:AAA family ATPase [Spirochaetia bacterium]